LQGRRKKQDPTIAAKSLRRTWSVAFPDFVQDKGHLD
jgi:hypothetical protein